MLDDPNSFIAHQSLVRPSLMKSLTFGPGLGVLVCSEWFISADCNSLKKEIRGPTSCRTEIETR